MENIAGVIGKDSDVQEDVFIKIGMSLGSAKLDQQKIGDTFGVGRADLSAGSNG